MCRRAEKKETVSVAGAKHVAARPSTLRPRRGKEDKEANPGKSADPGSKRDVAKFQNIWFSSYEDGRAGRLLGECMPSPPEVGQPSPASLPGSSRAAAVVHDHLTCLAASFFNKTKNKKASQKALRAQNRSSVASSLY